MQLIRPMNLNICWWNTKLTPPAGSKINAALNKELNDKVEEIISYLCRERPLHLIILCEVYKKDEPLIKKIAADNELEYIMIAEHVNGVYYDFAILYEKTRIIINKIEHIDEQNSFEQQLRIGVTIEADFDGEHVIIFLSHWNSDMFNGDIKKSHCAGMLRDKINAKFRNEHEHIILIGDYNSQPFENEIVTILETTKDLEIVIKRPRVLYNPFWRNLDSRSQNHSFSGSYILKNDAYDKWKTFDQMMFSSKFINGKSWLLDVYSPEIHNEFKNISFNFIDVFDHIPIYGRLHK